MSIKEYNGLNDEQILRNRKVYGDNVYYPSVCGPFIKKIKSILCHKISIFMMALIAITFVIALKLNGDNVEEKRVFIMPVIFSIAAFFIFIIGTLDGFKNKFFVLLIFLFIAQLSLTLYDFINNNVQFTQFYFDFGIILALLIATLFKFLISFYANYSLRNFIDFENDSLQSVIRNNNVCFVKRKELVVGDIIILNEGSFVPADCKLLDDFCLEVDESYVNGNKHVMKSHKASDCVNSNHDCIFNGSFVVKGKCVAQIIKVGKDSACHHKTIMQLAAFESQGDTMTKDVTGYQNVLKISGYAFAFLYLIARFILFFSHKSDLLLPFYKSDNFVNVAVMSLLGAVVILLLTEPDIIKSVFSAAVSFNLKSLKNNCLLPKNINACLNLGKIDILCVDEKTLLDPNNLSVADAVSSVVDAGIDIIIMSSDCTSSVEQIALDVGLVNDNSPENWMMTGKQFQDISDSELMSKIKNLKLLYSASENDKIQLIQLLRAQGLRVATTSLFSDESLSEISPVLTIAPQCCVDKDKESADIVLSDSSFHNLAYGIRWAKDLFNNIQHFLLYHVLFTFLICFMMIVGNFFSTNIIFHPTYLLWFYAMICCLAPFAFLAMPSSKILLEKSGKMKNIELMNKKLVKRGLFIEGIILILSTFFLYYLQQKNISVISDLLNIILPHKKSLNLYETTILFSFFSALMISYLIYIRVDKYSFNYFMNIKQNFVFIIVLTVFVIATILFVQVGHYICAVEKLKFTDWIFLFFTSFVVFSIYSLLNNLFQNNVNAFTASTSLSETIKTKWPKLKNNLVTLSIAIFKGMKSFWNHFVKFLKVIISAFIKLLIKLINLIQKWFE